MILSATDPRWLALALERVDEVLVDHAHCEKKAAASALSLVAAYPERRHLVRRLSALAIEELRHFRAVHAELVRRGLVLARDPGDPYAVALQKLLRHGREERFLDRLLVCGLIEARSRERLALLAEALPDAGLARLYAKLASAEAGHAELFRELAARYVPPDVVAARLGALARDEAELVRALPLAPRIH